MKVEWLVKKSLYQRQNGLSGLLSWVTIMGIEAAKFGPGEGHNQTICNDTLHFTPINVNVFLLQLVDGILDGRG